jgi:hypothetical protein
MNSKYFPTLSISEWFREPLKSSKGSIVWKALVEAFPLVGNWTVWRIGNGEKVRLGEDPWLGAGNNYKLSPPLLLFLKNKNLRFLSDLNTGFPQIRGRLGWKSAISLDLPEAM